METCPFCGTTNREHARFCSNCGAAFFGTQDLSPGTLLQGRYRIIRKLGHGGMGAVYLVEHTSLNKQFAIKEIREVEISDPTERANAVKQFQKEARLLAGLKHPNLPQVSDFFEENERQYLVMDLIQGETLEHILGSTSSFLPEQQVLDWAIQICNVLDYLHGQNPPVIFRDLKPGNIMVDAQGKVKLIDFGIAKLFNPAKTTDTLKMGTPGYAPPEQYGGQMGTDPRSDIYSLGAVLHHLVTRHDPQLEHPFYFPNVPIHQFNPDISDAFAQVLYQATAYEKDQRYPTVVEMREALQMCLSLIVATPVIKPSVVPEQARVPDRIIHIPLPPKFLGIVGALAVFLFLGCLIGVGLFLKLNGLPPFSSPPTLPLPFTPTPTSLSTPTSTQTTTNTLTPTLTPSPTNTLTPTPTFTPLPLTLSDARGIPMALIPAGMFQMGSEDGEDSERPIHPVYLDAYYIDLYEVTNKRYAACVAAQVCEPPDFIYSYTHYRYYDNPTYDDYPVINVSWNQAQAYCTWRGANLPTEAQWEKAARGGLEGKTYPWGNAEPTCTQGAENGAQSWACVNDTLAVGSFTPNGYGLYDMAGNVWEWVADYWNGHYYTSAAQNNPTGPTAPDSQERHVLRGGGWNAKENTLRVTARSGGSPTAFNDHLGFRCVLEP